MSVRLSALRPYIIAGVCYFLISFAASYLYWMAGTAPAPIMHPGGVALAAVILAGTGIWPAIFLGSLASGLCVGLPMYIVIASAIGNTLQAVCAGLFLKYANFDRRLITVEDTFLLIIAGLLFSMIAPTVGAISYELYNNFFDPNLQSNWTAWWISSSLSLLALTPFVTRWVRTPMSPRTMRQMIETVTALGLLALSSTLMFSSADKSFGGFSMLFAVWSILLWITFRLKPRFVTLRLVSYDITIDRRDTYHSFESSGLSATSILDMGPPAL